MASITLPRRTSAITPGFLAWLGLLGLLLVIGLVSAVNVLLKGLILTDMSNTVPWGLWITVDLSSIALGAGAFTLSAVVYLLGLKRLQPIVRLAVFVGFIGYSAALLALVMDIGRPDRFWHPWVYWNIHSVLWEITWCITIYLAILLIDLSASAYPSMLRRVTSPPFGNTYSDATTTILGNTYYEAMRTL